MKSAVRGIQEQATVKHARDREVDLCTNQSRQPRRALTLALSLPKTHEEKVKVLKLPVGELLLDDTEQGKRNSKRITSHFRWRQLDLRVDLLLGTELTRV